MATRPYDIIVIGAGIAGATAAWALAEDASVLIVERETQAGFHATGRSAAYFAPAYGNETVRNLTAASAAFYHRPPSGFSDTPLLRPRHALFVGTAEQSSSIQAVHDENPSLRRVDINEITARVPIIDETVIESGLIDETGGDLDVDAILQSFLKQFRKLGGELRSDFEVQRLTYKQRVWHMESGTDTFTAPIIVNAAGAWADQLAEFAGLSPLGLVPKRRTALLIDAPSGLDIAGWPLVIDVDEKFYFKPDAGQILVSPADETPSPPCDAQPEEWDVALAVDRLTRATHIEVSRVNHSWAGLRTFAPDKTFVVGFDPRNAGFFWLAGQGGYGVQSAPGMAQLARHLLQGSSVPSSYRTIVRSIDAVSPARFFD